MRRSREFLAAGVVATLLLSCSKRKDAAIEPASASSATAAGPTPSASAQQPAEPTAKSAVESWNDLHRRRDAHGLADVYADTVVFYGQTLSKDRVLALKAAAFEKAPDFTQSIWGVNMSPKSPDRIRAEFTKSWTQAGATKSTAAALEIKQFGKAFLIVEETDAPSEARAAAPLTGPFAPGLCTPPCGPKMQCVLGRVIGAHYEPVCLEQPPPDNCTPGAAAACPVNQKCCHPFANGCLGGWCPDTARSCMPADDCGD